MALRPARAGDIDAVFAIYMHESAIPFLGYDPMPAAEFGPVFEALCDGGLQVAELATGGVGGFIRAQRLVGRSRFCATLGPLAVRDDQRGTGLAEAMVRAAIAELHAAGVRRFDLIVESDNARGIRFYQRLGFVIEGTMRACYRRAHEDRDIDSYLMALVAT
jgi:ribosomal protein S18 acetylase RimI-like enzyme